MRATKYILVVIFITAPSPGFVSAYENCEEQENCEVSKRTKRSAEVGSCSDGAKTVLQATDFLNTFTYEQNKYDESNMKNKSEALKAIKTIIPAVCKNMTTHQAPLEFSAPAVAQVKVDRRECNHNESSFHSVQCSGCVGVGKYKIMNTVFDNSSQWNCSQNSSSDKTCDGVCVGAAHMPNDLISNFTTKCLSHVINLEMYNPTTSKAVQLNAQKNKTVMSLQIQFEKGGKSYKSSNFRCALWRENIKRWDPSSCKLDVVPNSVQPNATLATCDCIRFGSVCVVEKDAFPPIIEEEQSPVSNSPGNSGNDGSTSAPATTSGAGAATTESSAVTNAQGQGATSASAVTNAQGQVVTNSSAVTNGQGQVTTSSSGGGGGGGGGVNNGKLYGSITFPGDCKTIINTSKEDELKENSKKMLIAHLSIGQETQVKELKLSCGSLILTFVIVQLNTTTLDHKQQTFASMVSSNSFVITLSDGSKLTASASGMGQSSDNLTIVTAPPTTEPPTTRERFELQFDYRPLMFTVGIVILIAVLCVCCSCIVHSYWLRKDKFTKYNSMTNKEYERKMKDQHNKDRMKDFEEVPMQAIGVSSKVTPTNFDMSNETMPTINERSFTNYDWAHTSYLPATANAVQLGGDNEDAPKLMLDDDSDSDGERNKGYESDNENAMPRAVSHLSLAKEKAVPESSDSMSIAPPLYETVVEQQDNDEPLYDNIKDN